MSDENKLDALIVRNITDIEAAMNRASDHIDKKLHSAVQEIFEECSERYGLNIEDSSEFEGLWVASEDWRDLSDEESDLKYYIDLWFTHLDDRGVSHESWLSCFLNSNDNPIGIFVDREGVPNKIWKNLWGNDQFITVCGKLESKGFIVDKGRKLMWLKIIIDSEKLAQAFEDGGDLSEALGPISNAFEIAMSAKPELDEIVKIVRSIQ